MRLFLLLALFLSFAPPSTAQEAIGTITTENSAQQDAAIALRIREILATGERRRHCLNRAGFTGDC